MLIFVVMNGLKAENILPTTIDERDSRLQAFGTEVMQCLPYEPNDNQITLLAAFAHFIFYGTSSAVFLLK